jgi:hypothetical protein
MRSAGHNVSLLAAAGLLLVMLYPALFLSHRLAPEASLKSEPPWRVQWGPYPNPSPLAVEAATHLGPRLASISRDGLTVALWNPLIGGGRPGWLSSPVEGGAPLPVIAGLLARPGWVWTALLAAQLTAGFLASWWVLRLLGSGPWPAVIGATAYVLSGPVSGHWLDWQGSAFALGPLALVPVLAPPRRWRHRVAVWAAVLALLAASGAPALPFVALAAAVMIFSGPLPDRGDRWGAPVLAGVIVLALMLPTLWLGRGGGEPAAPPPAAQPVPPPATLSSLVVAPAPPRAIPAQGGARPPKVPAYLGIATLLLAALGVAGIGFRARGLWLGVFGVSLALAVLPGPLLARTGLSQRPLGVLAFSAAVLAAAGAQALGDRLPFARARHLVSLGVWLLVALALVPHAARRLPFAPVEDADLPSPIPASLAAVPTRLVGILRMLPPDVSATLALPDVRASSFAREPRYASLLGADRDGALPVSRALDPQTARLGARWLLEPLPLRVVSGEVFARIEPTELEARNEKAPDGLRRFRAEVPRGACRVGLRVTPTVGAVWLEGPGRRTQLESDSALAAESDAWRWFAVPVEWPAGPVTLALPERHGADGPRLAAAWDASGLRLAREEHGARVWQSDLARPLAFLATGVQPEGTGIPAEPTVVTVAAGSVQALQALARNDVNGRVELTSRTPSGLDLRVEAGRPALLVVQVKFRPALWHVTVNGTPATCERADGVWTGIAVPAGRSEVAMRVRLPLAVWLAAGGGLLALGALALPRRKQ